MTTPEKVRTQSLYSATAKLTAIEVEIIQAAIEYMSNNRQNSRIEQMLLTQTSDHLTKVAKQFSR